MKVNPAMESNYSSTRSVLARVYSYTVVKIIAIFPLVAAGLGILLGCASLSFNSLEQFPMPLLAAVGICMLALFFFVSRGKNKEWKLLIFAVVRFYQPMSSVFCLNTFTACRSTV